MFDKFSVSISVATILGVLGKLAFMYSNGSLSIVNDKLLSTITTLLLAIYLIFLRGKMMHDDSFYFIALENKTRKLKSRIALLLGYISWLFWAPAVFFLENLATVGICMTISFIFSSAWIEMDFDKKEIIPTVTWLFLNMLYIAFFLTMGILSLLSKLQPWVAVIISALLLLLLIYDWVESDPIGKKTKLEPNSSLKDKNMNN